MGAWVDDSSSPTGAESVEDEITLLESELMIEDGEAGSQLQRKEFRSKEKAKN